MTRVKFPIFLSLLFLWINPAFATEYTVCASGCDHTTIQAAVNAATSAGDIVTVKDGTYIEDIDSAANGSSGNVILIRSENEYGAVIDGENTKTYGFKLTHNYITIRGFWIKNGSFTGTSQGGIYSGGDYNTVEWCKFTANAVGANGAIIWIYGGDNNTVRGNKFESNTYSGADNTAFAIAYAKAVTVEGNHFGDNHSGLYYQMYPRNYTSPCTASNDTYQYNYFQYGGSQAHTLHIRDVSNVTFQHNYVKDEIYFRDDGSPDCTPENHVIQYNTVEGSGSWGIGLANVDNSTVNNNLVDGHTNWIDLSVFSCGGDNTLTNNDRGSSGASTGSCTGDSETGTTANCSNCINSTTKCNSLTARGSDLKISVWPFTKCDGTVLFSNYPYSNEKTISGCTITGIPFEW